METCFSCGGSYPIESGVTHPYMLSTESCWSAYGRLLEREYSDQKYWNNHRLTVDAYAVQHPGEECAQSIQSIAVHLISLYLVLEKELAQDKVTKILSSLTEKTFFWLSPPPSFGTINVGSVLKAKDSTEHNEMVRKWALSSWSSWACHHQTVRVWAKSALTEQY